MGFYDNPTNISSFDGLVAYNNTVTNGFFAIFMLAGVFLICFQATGNQRKEVSFAFSTFVTLISSIFFAALGLVGGHVVVVLAVLTAGAAAYLFMKPVS